MKKMLKHLELLKKEKKDIMDEFVNEMNNIDKMMIEITNKYIVKKQQIEMKFFDKLNNLDKNMNSNIGTNNDSDAQVLLLNTCDTIVILMDRCNKHYKHENT